MGVTVIAVGLLACAWAVLLLPDLRNRGSARGHGNSVKSFRDQLSGLDRTRPHASGHRPGARPATGRQSTPVRPIAGAARTAPGAPVVRRVPTAPRAIGSAASPLLPRSRAEAAQRRLLVLVLLVGLALVTFVGALVGPRMLMFVHLLVDATLAAYAYLLWERAARSRARHSSLVTLSSAVTDDDVVLQREASGS